MSDQHHDPKDTPQHDPQAGEGLAENPELQAIQVAERGREPAAMPAPTTPSPPPSQEPPPEQDKAAPRYFDMARHERVQELLKAGVATRLASDPWGDLIIGLRPQHVHAVVVAREMKERNIRRQHGLSDTEDLDAEYNIEITKAGVHMAITFAEGRIAPGAASLAIAKRHGFPVERGPEGEEVVVLHRDLDPKHVRDFFWPAIDTSWKFMALLLRLSQDIEKVKDSVLDAAGKDYVHGEVTQPGSAG